MRLIPQNVGSTGGENAMHRLYVNEDITVFWDSERCCHAKKCVTASPEAFDMQRRPWVDLSKDTTPHIWQTLAECPTGALSCVYNHEVRIDFDENERCSIALFGDDRIGTCEYKETETGWAISEVRLAPEYRNKNIEKRLVYKVTEEAERRKHKVHPECPEAVEALGGR